MIWAKRIIVGLYVFIYTTTLYANPVLDHIASGGASVQQTSTTTTINQTSQKAILNWNSFNIGTGETTNFQQPQGGVALNRISPTQGASQVYGNLTATSQIILVNPAGIYFGPGSYVNVGGMIATTANISDADFNNGNYRFTNVVGYNGAIINEGQIIAAKNGLIALVGGAVRNDGMIQANYGRVVLAAGESFSMSFGGDDMIGFSIDAGVSRRAVDRNGNSIADGVSHTGTITSKQVLISAKAASGVLDNAINMRGIVNVRSVYKSGGEIIISASPKSGVVRLSGKLNASSKRNHGGNITVTGDNILLDSTVVLNVTGMAGGGNVLIGGNAYGIGDLQHANAVVMLPGAKILADAGHYGSGGHVVLWSDNYTNINGIISARGGSKSGNGGFVETSSKNILTVGDFSVNTTAVNGRSGQWLLDPGDLTISLVNSNVSAVTPFIPTAAGATLNVVTLTAALLTNNVTVLTSNDGFAGNGDIIISSAINYVSANSLTLSAYRNISSLLNNAVINNSGSGSVILRADNAGTGTGTVSLTGTTPNITASGGVSIYYNPVAFGTNTALYSGGTTPTQYMLIQSLGTATDAATVRSLGSVSNNTVHWSRNFALTKNIDAAATVGWNAGAGFNPIGNSATPFTGKFDGQNQTISNLYINRPSTDRVGLFGFANTTAQIRNVNLSNVNITAKSQAGGLIGINFGPVNNVNVTGGTVTTNADSTYAGPNGTGFALAGGVIGYNNYIGTISNLSSSATVISTGAGAISIGGVVGQSRNGSLSNITNSGNIIAAAGSTFIGGITGWLVGGGTLANSSSSGTITADATSVHVGGLIGRSELGSTISNSFNTGSVTGGSYVGGLAGLAQANISNSYSTGSISGGDIVGGLVGHCSVGTISNAYATGNITATGNVYGGLVAWNIGTISNSYATGQVTGSATSYDGGGLVGFNSGIIAATVAGLTYAAGNVTAYHYAGGLVGWNAIGATINNAYASGNVSLTSTTMALAAGGIAGYNRGSIIATIPGATYATGTVTDPANGYYTGGVVGWNDAVITGVYATGTVSGYNYVGGVIGADLNLYGTSLVTNVYSTGNVTGRSIGAGGIIGYNKGILTATAPGLTYASGVITGNDKVGGGVGWNTGSVNNASYVGNSVTGVKKIGAFIADNSGSYTNTSVNNVTLTGLAGNNYFTLNVNNIIGLVQVNGTANGFTTYDFGGYAREVVATMAESSKNNGRASTSGLIFSNYVNIDALIGNPNFSNTLLPTTSAYPYLVRTSNTSGYFTDPLTYTHFYVAPYTLQGFSTVQIGSTYNQTYASPISKISEGSYRSNVTAGNIPTSQYFISPQWLVFGKNDYTILANLERPVMMQTRPINIDETSKIMLPISPYRSLTVQINNELVKY
jgi:filamentous hemagglutinin family protein